jgi:hypothetical protein
MLTAGMVHVVTNLTPGGDAATLTVGCLFQSTSMDKGKTWGNTRPMPIPNPNSKVHLIRMDPVGDLLLAFNNHRWGCCTS